jgi:hypothetical protein
MTNAVAQIPIKAQFNEAKISAFVIGKGNFSTGASQMACGDVTAVRFADGHQFVGLAHDAKIANVNYETKVSFDDNDEISSSEFTCAARRNAANKCSHVSALLHFLLAAKSYPTDKDKPKWGHRPGLERRFKGCSPALAARVKCGVTWSQFIERGWLETPKHADNDISTVVTAEAGVDVAKKKRSIAQADVAVVSKRSKRVADRRLAQM